MAANVHELGAVRCVVGQVKVLTAFFLLGLSGFSTIALADDSSSADCNIKPTTSSSVAGPPIWVDRIQAGLQSGACSSARWIDGLFGPPPDGSVYRTASGSVETAFLWSRYYGAHPRLRFHADLPLPQWDERVHAFVGRFDRNEVISEQRQSSGTIPRQFGDLVDEQTLVGLGYSGPPQKTGGWFDSSAGIRITTPLDPFLKGSYYYVKPIKRASVMTLKQTAFWDQREGFGITSRADLDHAFNGRVDSNSWFLRSEASATFSQRSRGVRGYLNATLFHKLSERRAVALQLAADGEMDAVVPLHDYGVHLIYRQNLSRDWLIVELRSSVDWPREKLSDPRSPSLGAGIGLELLFGGGRPLGGL